MPLHLYVWAIVRSVVQPSIKSTSQNLNPTNLIIDALCPAEFKHPVEFARRLSSVPVLLTERAKLPVLRAAVQQHQTCMSLVLQGKTSLHHAVLSGSDEVTRLLLQHSPDVTAKDDKVRPSHTCPDIALPRLKMLALPYAVLQEDETICLAPLMNLRLWPVQAEVPPIVAAARPNL